MLVFLHIPENLFFKILNLLLMEKSLIIYGVHSGIISTITLGILHLLQPFLWEGICVPLLPDSAMELYGAPIPYVIGTVKKPSAQDMLHYPMTAVLCLNDDTVQMTYYYPPARELAPLAIAGPVIADVTASPMTPTNTNNKRVGFYKHRQSLTSPLSTNTYQNTTTTTTTSSNTSNTSSSNNNNDIAVPLLTSLYSTPPSSSSSNSSTNRSYRHVKVVEISFISWFVRLPDLPVDLPPHYDLCIRIKHFRKSLSRFLLPYLHFAIYDQTMQSPANTSYPGHTLASVNKTLLQQTIALQNTTEMLLLTLPIPPSILQQCKLLIKLIKKYNFSWLLLGNSQYSNQQSSFGGIQDIYDWKRFLKTVPVSIPVHNTIIHNTTASSHTNTPSTSAVVQTPATATANAVTATPTVVITNKVILREVFQPESFLEPLRGQLEFQEALIHTQLFTTCLERYRQEYLFLNHIR